MIPWFSGSGCDETPPLAGCLVFTLDDCSIVWSAVEEKKTQETTPEQPEQHAASVGNNCRALFTTYRLRGNRASSDCNDIF